MTSKVRMKLGELEVECEGTEEFLKAELPKLLSMLSKLQPNAASELRNGHRNGSPRTDEASTENDVDEPLGTTETIAARIKCDSAPDLMIAAAAHLTFVSKKPSFTRKDMLAEMKAATSYYNKSMVNNFSKNTSNLIKAGKFSEVTSGSYSLTAKARAEVKKALGLD